MNLGDFNWKDITEGVAIGAFPWLSEFKNLDIHFKNDGLEISKMDNFFATLFATSIYTYSCYVNKYQFIALPEWWIFITFAFFCTIAYLFIFIYYKDDVKTSSNKIAIIVNCILYVFIFCSLTAGFGLLKVYKDDIVIKGKIVNKLNKPVVADFAVQLPSNNIITFRSDNKGEYIILFDKKIIDSITQVSISENGNRTIFNTYGQISVFNILKDIQLQN